MSLELNPVQKLAAEHGDGPLLVIAGPGSGKTRVITHRVAFLVNELGVHPDRIAAVTFTNRAAREMRDRMTNLLSVGEKFLTASTFHSLCARILRVDGAEIGVFPDYVIMDDSDQIDLVKRAMMDSQVDPKRFPPRNILAAISRSKAKLVNADLNEESATLLTLQTRQQLGTIGLSICLLYTSPSPRDGLLSRMPSSA